jgi:hypothetical protein
MMASARFSAAFTIETSLPRNSSHQPSAASQAASFCDVGITLKCTFDRTLCDRMVKPYACNVRIYTEVTINKSQKARTERKSKQTEDNPPEPTQNIHPSTQTCVPDQF